MSRYHVVFTRGMSKSRGLHLVIMEASSAAVIRARAIKHNLGARDAEHINIVRIHPLQSTA